jgi:phage terminase small subunit
VENEKHKRFCEEYLVDLNGKQAAIRAGYSEDRAPVTASELLDRPDIQDYLSVRQRELQEVTGINQKRVLEEYAKLAFIDIRKFYDQNGRLLTPHDIPDEAAAALAGIEVFEEFGFDKNGEKVHIGDTKKIKTYDKVKALDSLAKHLGMFKEIHELTGKNGQPLAAPVLSLQIPEGMTLNFPSNTDGEE